MKTILLSVIFMTGFFPILGNTETAAADIGSTAEEQADKNAAATPVPPESKPKAVSEGVTDTAAEDRAKTAGAGLAPERINANPVSVKSIKLSWEKKTDDGVYYNVFRRPAGGGAEFVRLTAAGITETEYVDFEIATATAYEYRVHVIDSEGNTHISGSQTVTSANLVVPDTPVAFRTYQDIESVQMKWNPVAKRSFDVSGYNVYRGKTPGDTEKIAFVKAESTKYNDNDVEPAIKYYYKMTSVDIEGNESIPTETQAVVPFPAPRTGLVMMPTAFRNNIYDNLGFNVDISFDYFIGTLFGGHSDLLIASAGTDLVSKIGIVILTVDAKGTIINEYERWPSVGAGFTYSMLLQEFVGSSDTTGIAQQFSIQESLIKMYGLYAVVSKLVMWKIGLHGGYMFSPEGNYSQTKFMSYLSEYIVSEEKAGDSDGRAVIKNSQSAYFLGLHLPVFNDAGIKIEYVVPWEANKQPLLPDYYIINSSISRLMSFNVGYFHYPNGFAFVGYIDIRFTVFPNPYK